MSVITQFKNAFTLNSKKNEESANMEDMPITIPLLEDGIVAIGDLWNCVEGKPCGLNLFGQELESKHLAAYTCASQDYTLAHIKGTKDKVDSINVKADVSLELMKGKIKLAGGVSYDKQDDCKFNEEKLECKYRLLSYSVRALPSAKECVDKYVKDQLLDKKLKATHVCMELVTGAETIANIYVKSTDNVDSRDISGYFKGSLEMGVISATAEVALKKLDTDNSSGLEKRITVHSKPPLENNPQNIEQMLTELEKIPERVRAEKHFEMITLKEVIGIPLQFKLVPIKQFMDFKAELRYKVMAESTMDEFMDMITTLKDFQQSDYLKRQIVQNDRRLQVVLSDPHNALTSEVEKKGKEYQKASIKLQADAFKLFEEYKNGSKKDKDLRDMVTKYKGGNTGDQDTPDEDENKVEFGKSNVETIILNYVKEGKELLARIQIKDLCAAAKVSFFTNETDLKDWFVGERKVKLLIRTSLEPPPQGALLFIYDNSAHLEKLGIEVGVAYPNLSKFQPFTMTLKGGDRQTTYEREKIPYALQVLACAVGKADLVPNRFYTVFAALTGIQLPLPKESLTDITCLITALQEIQHISICSSYLQLLERINNLNDKRVKFVLTMDACDSIADSVHFFKRMSNHLQKVEEEFVEWIVGTFSLHNFHQAPLLFVFHGGKLISLCLDNLDLQILLEYLEVYFKPDSDDISTPLLEPQQVTKGCLYPNRCNYGIQVAEILGKSMINFTESKLKLRTFPENNDRGLENAIKFNRAVLSNNPVEIISKIAEICTEFFSDLTPNLQKHGWNATTNYFAVTLDRIKWGEVAKSLRSYFSKCCPFFAKVEYALSRLKDIRKETEAAKNGTPEPKIDQSLNRWSKPQQESINVENSDPDSIIKSVVDDIKYGKDLKGSLATFTDSDCSRDIKINGAIAVLQKFVDNAEKHFEDPKFFYLLTFINLVDKMADSDEALLSSLVDVNRKFIDNVFIPVIPSKKSENDEKQNVGNITTFDSVATLKKYEVYEKLCDYINRKSLFQTLSLLSKCQFDFKMFKVHQTFYNLNPFSKDDKSRQINASFVEDLDKSKMEPEQYKELWSNPKFQYVMLKSIQLPSFLEAIKNLQCKGATGMDLLPKEFQAAIKPLLALNVSDDFDWKKTWASPQDFLEALQTFAVRGLIPEDFQKVFSENSGKQETYKMWEDIKEAGIITYWDGQRGYFTEPWDLDTVSSVIEFLMKEDKVDISPLKLQQEESSNKTDVLTNNSSLFGFSDKFGANIIEEYFKIGELQERPLIEPEEFRYTLLKLIPYIMQNIKMGNPSVIRTETMNSYFEQICVLPGSLGMQFDLRDISTSNQNKEQLSKKTDRLARTDFLTLLCATEDGPNLRGVISKFSSGHFGAIPLVVPLTEEFDPQDTDRIFAHKILYPVLENILIEWKSKEGALISHLLFSEQKFKLIVAVKLLGDKAVGKSRILNELFNTTCPNMFGTHSEENKDTQLVTGGLVEFTWLTPATCKPKLWATLQKHHYKTGNEELLLLANLHGNANQFPHVIREMANLNATFLMFLMPCNLQHMKSKIAAFNEIFPLGGKSNFKFLVDPRAHCAAGVPQSQIITTPEVGSDALVEKLQSALLELYSVRSEPWSPSTKFDERIIPAQSYNSAECNNLLNFIKKRGIKKIKSSLELQTLDLTMEKEVAVCFENNSTILTELFNKFIPVILLPESYRQAALAHLEAKLKFLSEMATLKIKEQLVQMKSEAKSLGNLEHNAEWQNQILELKNNINERTLTVDNIWREFSIAAEYMENGSILKVSECRHFISGGIINLNYLLEISGIWGKIPGSDSSEIHQKLSKLENLRIFVISIVGLESSGKSTILNLLFGTNFPVGIAGCTTGIKTCLVYLNRELADELNTDAILVLDCEGFDPYADEETKERQRGLMALTINLSHLAIINSQEDSFVSLAAPLEISLLRTLRLDDSPPFEEKHHKISTEFIFLQNGLPESSISYIHEDVHHSLSQIKILEEQSLEIGLRCTLFDKFFNVNNKQRISESVYNLGKYKFSENGPITETFHRDISCLYEKILKNCRESEARLTFQDWYLILVSCSNNITADHFPLGHPDLEDMQNRFNLEEKISKIKDAVDIAFWEHSKHILTPDPEATKKQEVNPEWTKIYSRDIKSDYRKVGSSCPKRAEEATAGSQAQCEYCTKILVLREELLKELQGTVQFYSVEKQLNAYTNLVRNNILNAELQKLNAREIKKNPQGFDERSAALKVKVIPAKRLINAEIKTCYNHLYDISWNWENDKLPSFKDVRAFYVPQHSGSAAQKKAYLNWEQEDILQAKLKDIPDAILRERNSELYQIGMVREVKKKISEVLADFKLQTNKVLMPEILREVHRYGMHYLYIVMNKKQEEWDKQNNPLKMYRA